jgi:hypothetical protein
MIMSSVGGIICMEKCMHACMLTIVFFITLGQNKNNTVIKTNLKAKGHTTIPHTHTRMIVKN